MSDERGPLGELAAEVDRMYEVVDDARQLLMEMLAGKVCGLCLASVWHRDGPARGGKLRMVCGECGQTSFYVELL